jgi:protein TonB
MLSSNNVRFSLAVLFALGVHGLLLSMDFSLAPIGALPPRQHGQGVTLHLTIPATVQEKREKAVEPGKPAISPPVPLKNRIKQANPAQPAAEQGVNTRPGTLASTAPPAAVQSAPSDFFMDQNQTVQGEADSVTNDAEPGMPKNTAAETSEEGGGVLDAVPLYKVNRPPAYPGLAKKRGDQGTVLLDVFVLSDGTVGDVQVAESSGYRILDRAAAQAVDDWLFSPALRNGRPTDMRVRIPVRFELR